jgi:ATP-dependent DNA ligase
VRLLTRNGHDWAPRYPLIVEAVNVPKVRSCLIDGEAVVCDDNGLAVFDLPRNKRQGRHMFLCVFDLLELNGNDLRREPVEVRKAGWRNWCASLAQTIPHLGIPGTSLAAARSVLAAFLFLATAHRRFAAGTDLACVPIHASAEPLRVRHG